MTITVCPVALKGTGKCWDRQCRLRHDVVHCKPCKCFVLHGDLQKHRRGEDHRLKCGFGAWKAAARRPAQAILPSRYPYVPKSGVGARKAAARRPARAVLPSRRRYVPKPKQSEKRTRKLAEKEKPAGASGIPLRGEVAQYLSVSGEEGLYFKSEVGVGNYKKTKSKVPLFIRKIVDNDSLTLVSVDVTGPGSGG